MRAAFVELFHFASGDGLFFREVKVDRLLWLAELISNTPVRRKFNQV
jgi:hypothetical protein